MKDQQPAELEQALWLSPEDQARLAAFKAYAVNHALLEDVDTRLTQAILEPAGFANLLVYGPSGVGKTTMLRRPERQVRELTRMCRRRVMQLCSGGIFKEVQ